MKLTRPEEVARLQALVDSLRKEGVDYDNLPVAMQDRIGRLVRYSPYFTAACTMQPSYMTPLLQAGKLEEHPKLHETYARLKDAIAGAAAPYPALRRFHRQELVRIAWRDLCDIAPVEEITLEISNLAEAVCGTVYDLEYAALHAQFGTPINEGNGNTAYLCVIALGKFGGKELNFSSDIDLMFVYDAQGHTQGGATSITNADFFTQLAQRVCDELTKPSEEGFMYRVDTRIRPEGTSGALAVPLMTVEIYYPTYGQNWERQALLKARVICGGIGTGKNIMSIITPFTYRKYVDEVEIADVLRGIDSLRSRSLNEIGNEAAQRNNFKNGYGGIRDIEFFVQGVQLLYGGQYPEIKLAGTLVSLQRMHESHLLHSNEFDFYNEAYCFLRRVEHRLQMRENQQVYTLPAEPDPQAVFAESLGFESYAAFRKKYDEITTRVRELYETIFKRPEWASSENLLVDSDRCTAEIEESLRQYGFDDPKQAFTFIKSLQKSPELHLQTKTDRLFKAVLPRLLLHVKNSPDSGLALLNFDRLVTAYKAKTALYQTLCDEPPLLDLLVSVISNSPFLTSLVLRDPSLIETAGREGVLKHRVTKEYLESHLAITTGAMRNAELRDQLLRVQNAAMFQSGVRFVIGLTDVVETGRELAAIAEFVLEKTMQPPHEQLAARYPEFSSNHADEIAVIGMGKLGGGVFNVASDCDVIFVFPENRITDEVASAEYFHRWATKYIEYLQQKTTLGFLYHVDARLRPHGGNSPLAVSFNGMKEYYQNHAQFWEKMALTRARFICGNQQAKGFLDELKQEALFSRPPTREEIESLLEMRSKIEKEKSGETLKAAPGGLIDIEFTAQAIVLLYGYKNEAVRQTSTGVVIETAWKEGILPDEDAQPLLDAYRTLREVENRLRIVNNASIDALPEEETELEKITRRYALKLDSKKMTPASFREMIQSTVNAVRQTYDRFFERVKSSM